MAKKKLTYTHDEVQALLDRIIEVVKVNGTALAVSERAVDVPVPTRLSELEDLVLELQEGALELSADGVLVRDSDAEMSVVVEKDRVIIWENGGRATTIMSDGRIFYGGAQYQLPSYRGDWTFATTADLDGKVDKESGKGLSTNDYTDSDKAKLDSVALDELIYKGDTPGSEGAIPDFDAYADTVWNKAQTLSPAQQEQARQNLGIDFSKCITTDDEVIIDCGTSSE